MKTEDYSRATRVINDVQQDNKAVVTAILRADGSLFVSNCGDTKSICNLYDSLVNYWIEVWADKK